MDGSADVAAIGLRPIGTVRSRFKRREDCPRQGFEGAPEALIVLEPAFEEGLEGLAPGGEVIVLTWFHEARRDVLKVHPRNDPQSPLRGVFVTRSPDRPNPIGLHRVAVVAVDGGMLRVGGLEALDGTPVLDIKPVLSESDDA
jgi:tRNA-Thr(GGU) m(6)t(6)A37 methyltransferase TsaA